MQPISSVEADWTPPPSLLEPPLPPWLTSFYSLAHHRCNKFVHLSFQTQKVKNHRRYCRPASSAAAHTPSPRPPHQIGKTFDPLCAHDTSGDSRGPERLCSRPVPYHGALLGGHSNRTQWGPQVLIYQIRVQHPHEANEVTVLAHIHINDHFDLQDAINVWKRSLLLVND
jgi:hypothetical protein